MDDYDLSDVVWGLNRAFPRLAGFWDLVLIPDVRWEGFMHAWRWGSKD